MCTFLHFMEEAMAAAELKSVHSSMKCLYWLLGRWKTECGLVTYPTMQDVMYAEEIDFLHSGLPVFNIRSLSWNKDSAKPMHREEGFLKCNLVDPHKFGLLLAHNNGVSEVSEGSYDDKAKVLKLVSTNIGRLSFGSEPRVIQLEREYRLNGDKMEMKLLMATNTTPLTTHLQAQYEKI